MELPDQIYMQLRHNPLTSDVCGLGVTVCVSQQIDQFEDKSRMVVKHR